MDSKNRELYTLIDQLRVEGNQKCQKVEREIECLREEVSNVVESALEEFNVGLDELRTEETELASISESLMDIIKCLVKKTGQAKEQKPLDLIDILKANIIDINSLKIQQNAIHKELQNLKPAENSSRRQKMRSLKQILESSSMGYMEGKNS